MEKDLENTPKTQLFSTDLKASFEGDFERSKTSLRMVYEAQAEVIQTQIGDLETVRMRLGLSARKICQLLMVDPSAWNRWTRRGAKAPPHVWRSLQWYLSLQDKLPGLTPQYFIERVVARGDSKALAQVGELSGNLEKRLSQQAELLGRQERQIQGLKWGLYILGGCLGLLILILAIRSRV